MWLAINWAELDHADPTSNPRVIRAAYREAQTAHLLASEVSLDSADEAEEIERILPIAKTAARLAAMSADPGHEGVVSSSRLAKAAAD
jgi:hypothetical protein